MNKILFKIISLILIQVLLLGNMGMACEIKSRNFTKHKTEQGNLSPRIMLNTPDLNSMFINSVWEREVAVNPGFFRSLTSLNGLTEYAKAKKTAGKTNNLVYLLFKKRLARRDALYTPKARQKKEFIKDIKKLKKLFSERRKWIKSLDLIEAYEQQINSLEESFNTVETQGDWDDLLELGIKLNKALLKHGALASELSRIGDTGKKGKSLKKNKLKNRTLKPGPKNTNDLPELTNEDHDKSFSNHELFEVEAKAEEAQRDNLNTQSVILDQASQDSSEQLDGFIPSTVSARKHVLVKALEILTTVFDAAYQELPVDTVIRFQEKINQLQQGIAVVKKGEFSLLKKQLRTIEAELLTAIKENNKKLAEILPEPQNESIQTSEITQPDKGNPQISKSKKQVKPLDEFAQAVILCDPENIPLRSVDAVKNELKGQVALLKQVIDAEMDSGMEQLIVFNINRETDGLVIQVRFSEALAKIEPGSDIVMESEGKYYELKCSNILNAGSKLLLKPANKKNYLPEGLPLDRKEVKFYYIPSTHSEDLQRKTLQTIIRKINGKDKSTGIAVLDYFLRIKSAAKDINDIEELKQDIAYAEGMDKFQKAAVNMILKTKFGLVLGPFGTGKTRVLLAAAKNIILKKKKPVFIIAPQHKIADDITLAAGNSQMPVIRCGKNQRKINSEVLVKYSRHSTSAQEEFMRRYKELNLTEEDNGCLFVGTDMGASLDLLINQLRNPESAKFLKDVTVIVDEAALINYPELITALYILKPDALILVGDHLQFSPYKLASRFSGKIMELFQKNISQKAICRYHISSFKELIAMPFNRVSLLVNYRNPWISVDLLKEWYRGVINLQSISNQRGDKIDADTFVVEDTATWEKQSFAEPYQYGSSPCNKTEALWILKRIKYFLAEGNKPEDITVITYYNGQIKLISDLIDANFSDADSQILKQNIFTPISIQGGENKIVLVSLVRSEKNIREQVNGNGFKKTNPLFLSEPEFAKPEALLVLLSRNKGKLNVIGDRETLDVLTKQNYPRANHLYSCLFNHKGKVQLCLDMQNIELSKSKEISANDFVQSAI
ncbi:MAG: AAA family ATPase [Candidatus Omnitrophica bacterium]|nr:AAA family ATPase [Candidatus Omnitrophota bacterium]